MTMLLTLGRLASEDTVVRFPLERMPHMMIAGMTGSGKSLFMHGILDQLFELSIGSVRVLLFDPKRVELAGYREMPHLLAPPVFDPDDMISALYWAQHEMELRFEFLESEGFKDMDLWNEQRPGETVPRIVIAIDELANVVQIKGLQPMLASVAMMGRAAGIHLILATQRPSADVLDSQLRANIPTRVAFATMTRFDSEVILGMRGAEKLPLPGHMLVMLPGRREPVRLTTIQRLSDETTAGQAGAESPGT
jgi:S-DNA-T family DNA segregation ATPase FtsK/SpoIIIE